MLVKHPVHQLESNTLKVAPNEMRQSWALITHDLKIHSHQIDDSINTLSNFPFKILFLECFVFHVCSRLYI